MKEDIRSKNCKCCGGQFYGPNWAICCGPCAASHSDVGEEEKPKKSEHQKSISKGMLAYWKRRKGND